MKSNKEMSELVRRFTEGDKEALGEIYAETKDTLVAGCRKQLRGYEDYAEDVVQNTYVKALESMNSVRKPESAVAWLRTVAGNNGKDLIEKEKKYVYPDPYTDDDGNAHDWTEVIPDCSADSNVDEAVCRSETARIVDYILEKLDERKAALLIMHDASGIPLKEISESTSMKEGTIKSTLSRARQEFKALWEGNAA